MAVRFAYSQYHSLAKSMLKTDLVEMSQLSSSPAAQSSARFKLKLANVLVNVSARLRTAEN
jgi:hypothetical protein